MKIMKGKKRVCEAGKADNLFSKAWGWMLHKPKEKEGLLFTWAGKGKPAMWMPLMLTAINMAFIDDDLRVVDFVRAEPISLNPRTWRLYVPKKQCKYVLELHEKNTLKIGDRLSFLTSAKE